MTQRRSSLKQIFEAHIQTLSLSLSHDTVTNYHCVARRFLAYLHTAFPQVRRPSQLRRDPHLLGWFRCLCEQNPPLCAKTRGDYLLGLRRLLDDLTDNGYPIQPDLIRREDFPPPPQYLPRPLSSMDDQKLQQELRRTDDLWAHALLLTRLTGMRIGECIDLPLECLQQIGTDQWAVHVPLGKLHTERLVPADAEVRHIVARILVLRALTPLARLANSQRFLLPRRGAHYALVQTLRLALAQAAKRAGCSIHVTPHRLRHTFATEMLQFGISLPALMKLLGHKDIRMTLRYVQVTQQDLQREFHQARQNVVHGLPGHRLPTLGLPKGMLNAGLPGIRQALEATRHLLEMYRRQLSDEKTRRRLQRLDKRLLGVASQLEKIANYPLQKKNEERLAS
jgi:site-specific recombinase XerD